MTPAEFREALHGLDMTERQFAKFARCHERSVRRWLAGERGIPAWVPVMLGLMRRTLNMGEEINGE